MKTKLLLVVLALLCVGLGVALVVHRKQAQETQQQDQARIAQLSNEWTTTSTKLTSQIETNGILAKDLEAKQEELTRTASQLSDTKATLAKLDAEAKAAAKAAEEEMAKRDAKITELEAQNTALDKQANDLKTSITGLESKIAETQRKLAASEGDREFLLKELKRLQAEKAELERQFNDLAVLREQVHKLKEELAISRRLEWIKKGLYGIATLKGAERMQLGLVGSPPPAANTNYNLNVEIHQDGGAKVVPPANPATTADPKK